MLTGLLAHGIVPVQAAENHALSAPQLLNPDGTLNLESGYRGALDISGYEIRLDPQSGPLLRPMMAPNTWNALGNGLESTVYAIAIDGTDVYVGGGFADVGGDLNADGIVKWDGASWSALGSGINGTVYSIAIRGDDIYAAGSFHDAGGDLNADYVAGWNGSTWYAMGNGLNQDVNVVAVSGSNVYVAGKFTDAGGVPSADYIAKLDGGTWESLGTTPLNGAVSAMVVVGADVYVGGVFNDVGGNPNLDRIARWDGASWSALGSGLNGGVNAIAIDENGLYAGGTFINAGGNANADYIAKWDGAAWSALDGGLNEFVTSLAVHNGKLYVGGVFTDAGGDANADRIARWDGTSWSALGGMPLSASARTIAISGADLYAGGNFLDAGGNTSADRIARFEIDSSAPTIHSFAATTPSASLNIPITDFTASDDAAITGYLITTSDIPPLASAGGWVVSAPTTYTVAGDGSYTLYPWVKDGSGNVSAVYGAPILVEVDAGAPVVTSFTAPSFSTSYDIPIMAFTASDTISVAGYLITESSTPPSAGQAGWAGSAPSTYTVESDGSHTLYPWVKDALNNVSAVYASPVSVHVDVNAPIVNSFTAASPSTSLTTAITAFTASDDIGVTGYLVTASNTPPLPQNAGWTASAPTTYTFASNGNYTLYPWVRDAAGNVSTVYGTPVNVTVDATKPTVTAFTVPSASNSLNIPITTFTASDNLSIGGYLITTSNSAPPVDAVGWTPAAPATFAVGGNGSYTLYPWVKDTVGNVSAVYGSPISVTVDVTAPTLTVFSPLPDSTSRMIPIQAFTASDNVGVTGYLITETSTPPSVNAAGWTASAPTTYTVASDGIYTLYAWAKDAVGNLAFQTASTRVDTALPAVTSFTASSLSGSLDIPIPTFTGSDEGGITAYLVTTSNTPPPADGQDWSASAPASYTVPAEGIYTLYPWVQDILTQVSDVYASPVTVTVDINSPTVSAFSVPSVTNSVDIPITTFTATDTMSVNAYLITTSDHAPAAEDSGWSGSVPSIYTVAGDGTYTLYPWVKDEVGHVSAAYGSPASVTVDASVPSVMLSNRADANFTNLASVAFTVTFSESVTGVDAADFSLSTSGVTGTSIASLTGGPTIYTVTVNTGSGNGTIRLDVQDDDSITDAFGNSLGGPGPDNGDFASGEEYTIVKSAVKPGVPALLSPATGALATSTQPLLDWKNSSPAAHHYQIQLSTNRTFTALVVDEANILLSEFMPPVPLAPGKLYYWRVRALNIINGASAWSTVRTFKTPLAQPISESPIGGVSLVEDRTSFGWTSVEGAAQYTLQISTVDNFSTLLVNANVNTNEYDMTKDLPQNKKIYWRVRAKTPAVTGPWSVRESFTTGNPPTVPVLAAPANNALVKTYLPLLNWSNSTVPVGTLFKTYMLEVDDDSDFSSPEITATSAASQFTPVSDLAPNTKYYWRVRAVNTINDVDHFSAWSPVWSFRTVIPAPGSLVVNATATPQQPGFDWDDAVAPVTGYTIQVSTSATFSTFIVNSTTVNSTYTMTKNLPIGKPIYWRVRVNGVNGPSAWSTMSFSITP